MIPFRCFILALVVLFFGIAGVWHFTRDDMFASIVPPYVPYPYAMVYISGVAECLGALGLLLGAWHRWAALRLWAGWGLIILSVMVFPANIHMALNPEQFSHIDPWRLYVRLPLQALIIWAIYFAMKGPVYRQPQASLSS